MILWWKGNKKSVQAKRSSFGINRSQSCPDGGAAKKGSGTEDKPEKLILKTRLRHGKISYDEQDVEVRLEGWTAPQRMAKNLWMEWRSTKDAELLVYRELNTGNERTVVNKVTVSVAGVMQSVGSTVSSLLPSSLQIQSHLPFCGSSKTLPPENEDLVLD